MLADQERSEAVPACHSFISITSEQAAKIHALAALMKSHYDPLPTQLQNYMRLLLPYALGERKEEAADGGGDSALPLERTPTWFYCGCFLVSREWDVERAFLMMQDTVAYRATYELDTRSFFPSAISVRGWEAEEVNRLLGKEAPRVTGDRIDRLCAGVSEALTSGIHYWDKEGRPVSYVMIDSLDEPELMRQLQRLAHVGQSRADVLWEYGRHFLGTSEHVVMCQLIQQAAQKARAGLDTPETPGLPQGVITLVINMKGLSLGMLWKPMLDLFRDFANGFFQHYPDVLHRIICINSPGIVRYAYRLVRGFMPAAFQKKFSFFSPQESLAALEADIDRRHIPRFLGGDCCCPTGPGKDCGCFKGYDPQHPRRTRYRDTRASEVNDGDGGVSTEDVTLAAGAHCTRAWSVAAHDEVLWEFSVVGGGRDITFSSYFVPASAGVAVKLSKPDTKALAPFVVSSEALPEGSNLLSISEKGVAVLEWCNTRSWFASKHLQFRAHTNRPPNTPPSE